MVAHGSCEVKFIQRRMCDIGEVCELVIDGAFASEDWGKDIGVLKSIVAE